MASGRQFAWVLAVAAGATAPMAGAADSGFAWPGGHRAAISLAYDDALDSQLDTALPALDRHGFKASFYLTLASPTLASRLPEWRAAASNGHELGNHTLFHQCSGSLPDREWVPPERDLDTMTAEQMREQVLLANVMLAAIDGRDERTFAVPCGDAMAAGVDYVARVAPGFVAVRRGEGGSVADPAALDPEAVAVAVPVGASGADLVALVEETGRTGGLLALTFHGVGGDHLAVSTAAHAELLDHLAANRDLYLVDTFISLMRHVRAHQALQSPSLESE